VSRGGDDRTAHKLNLAYALRTSQNQHQLQHLFVWQATVGAEVPGGAIMYWGEGGQRTPLHYDPYENFMCAIDGAKLIRLYHPSAAAALYPKDGVQYKYSQVCASAL
jgi:hypothetical protein